MELKIAGKTENVVISKQSSLVDRHDSADRWHSRGILVHIGGREESRDLVDYGAQSEEADQGFCNRKHWTELSCELSSKSGASVDRRIMQKEGDSVAFT